MITYEEAKKYIDNLPHGYHSIELEEYIDENQIKNKLFELYKRLSYYAKYDGYDPETRERVMEIKDEIKALEEELNVK